MKKVSFNCKEPKRKVECCDCGWNTFRKRKRGWYYCKTCYRLLCEGCILPPCFCTDCYHAKNKNIAMIEMPCFDTIPPKMFDTVVRKLRTFFYSKGFVEAYVQNRLSILAACEDPKTISCFDYDSNVWPLPQTGQMWLEYEMLKNPDVPGYFCLSTSYRDEPNPVPGRHSKLFPLFEFELKGDMEDLIKLERELLEYLGFGFRDHFPRDTYENVAEKYSTKELENIHEEYIKRDYGEVFFLTNFPNFSSPFWNMAQEDNNDRAYKVDVIVGGVETIGSAQRSSDPEEMRKQFHTISEGGYANILYEKFGKDRVEAELEDFLSQDFFTRSGGGIGLTRLIKAMCDLSLL